MGTCDDGALRCCRARASRCPPSGQRSFHALSKGGAAPKVHSDLSCRRQFIFPAGIAAFDWGASREAQTSKGSVGPRGDNRTKSTTPTRRERFTHRKRARGGGKSMGSRRWRWASHRRDACWRRARDLSNTQDACYLNVTGRAFPGAVQKSHQTARALPAALGKVCRAPQLIRDFNHRSKGCGRDRA